MVETVRKLVKPEKRVHDDKKGHRKMKNLIVSFRLVRIVDFPIQVRLEMISRVSSGRLHNVPELWTLKNLVTSVLLVAD